MRHTWHYQLYYRVLVTRYSVLVTGYSAPLNYRVHTTDSDLREAAASYDFIKALAQLAGSQKTTERNGQAAHPQDVAVPLPTQLIPLNGDLRAATKSV